MVVSILLLTSFRHSPDDILLELKLTPGDVYQQDVQYDFDIEMDMMGMEMNVEMRGGMGQQHVVHAIPKKGGANVLMSIERFKMKYSMSGMTELSVEYDSENPSDDPVYQEMDAAMRGLLEMTNVITYNAQGVVIDEQGADLMSGFYAEAGMSGGSMDWMMGNGGGLMMAAYSKKAVAIGDSWETTTKSKAEGIKSEINATYRLKSRESGTAYIDLDATLELKGSVLSDGLDIEVRGKGTVKGILQVDEKTGWTNQSALQQKLAFYMITEGIEMPMTLSGTMNTWPSEEK